MSDDDPDTEAHERFVATARQVTPDLAEALAGVGPVTLPGRGDQPLGRFLARAVVGQQLSTAAARTIRERLDAAAAAAGQDLPGFADAVATEELRACGLSRNKARALAALAAAERAGALDSAHFAGLDHAAVSARLGAIWGVGQWTCDMAAIFWCGCGDVWPENDVAVQRTFRALIGHRRSAAKAAARFAPERSRLAVYMWRITDAVPD
ncbi:MAG: hypothetical protein U5K43_00775 [Halofilum sp. (in: g-proteobacteria)]|nr:hypothetical protein [Halofilum sp. (in: g-proteobacteria)]